MAIMRYLRIGDNRYEIADEKIKVSEISPGITYYPIIGNGAIDTSASRQWDSTGLQYEGFGGEEEGEVGNATLSLGNDISVGEIDSKRGNLVLYGEEGSYSVLQSGATGEGTGYYILLPDKQGTVALTNDIPSRTSQLTNDSGFLTSYTETDPTVPTWAKARTKPTYTAAEVGAIGSVTVSRALVEGVKSATITVDGTSYDIYSKPGTITGIETTAGAHTTIDVSSGAVSFNVPTNTSHLINDSGFITSYIDEKIKLVQKADNVAYKIILGPNSITSGNTYEGYYSTLYHNPSTFSFGTSKWYINPLETGFQITGGITTNKTLTVNQTITLGTASEKSYTTSINTSDSLPTANAVKTFVENKGYITDAGVTKISTTAGAHTAVTNATGAVSFNVPTTAAHVGIKFGYTTSGNNRAVLQDSSGNLYVTQKDDNSNTTYTLSGALSSHKFTSTLTAGGSGSGTSVSEITFVAGTGITLTDDTTNKKITIAASGSGSVTSVAATGSGGITISGSPITSTGTLAIGLNLSTAINGLSEGTSPAQLDDYAVVQWAGGGITTTTYHRRKLTNLIVGKAVADQNGLRIDTGYLKLTGGQVTGPTTFGNSVSISDLNTGQLIVNGSASVVNTLNIGRAINHILTGTGTAGSDKGSGVSPRYFPAKWTFNTGSAPTNGDIVVIKTPVAGHDYGVFLSIDNGSHYHPITLSGTGRLTTHWPVGSYVALIFDSSNSAASMFALAGGDSRVTVSGGTWRSFNYYSSGNTYTQALCTTAAATAAKGASMSYYVATANRYVMVNMVYANTSATAITLNINGTGAKPIYINGSASSTSNYTLPAGSYLVFYDGTNYYFRTDNYITGNITGHAYSLRDKGNGTATTVNYSSAGMTSTSWFAAWDGYNLRAINPANTLSTIGALPLTGGTLSGDLLFSDSGTATRQIRGIAGANDYWRIAGGATASNAGWMEIATADDGNEPIYVRQYTGAYTTIKRTLTLLDADGNSSFPGTAKIEKIDSLNSNYKTINCDVSQAEVKAQNSSLTSSSADTDWFQALVKAICVKYPNISNTVFKGVVAPNSNKFYEVFIYNTSTVDSTTKLPQHSFGRALNYGGGFTKFGTDSYTWRFGNVDSNTTYSSLAAASGGTAVSLVTTGEKYTWNSKTANTGTVTSITLTQGDGISIGSSGTAITTSGSRTIALATSGATAGSYGPSANASPAHSGTFSVPYITVDKYGRVTAISTKTITLPASGNTDTKLTQTVTTTNASYPILMAPNGQTATTTTTGYFSTTLNWNPNTKILYVSSGTTTGNIYMGLANSDALYTAINSLGWASSVIV